MEKGRASEDEDRYMLSPFARLYIQKFIRPSPEDQKRLIVKQNILRSAQDEFAARAGADVFNINTVYARDKDDYIVAKILTRAIERIFKKSLLEAEQEIAKAIDLSPNYFEVHRVDALLRIALDDYVAAEASYETAVSLAPGQAPLRVRFAGFLSRQLGDQDRALEQLLIAERLLPSSGNVKLETARVLQYQRKFDEADLRLRSMGDIEKLPAWMRRMHLDLSIQNHLRKADHLLSQERFLEGLENFERAKAIFYQAPSALIDRHTLRHVSRSKRQLPALSRAFKGLAEEERASAIERWLAIPQEGIESLEVVLSPDDSTDTTVFDSTIPNRGKLAQLHSNYGFIDTGSSRYFFHRGNWVGKEDFISSGEGALVDFDIGKNDKGVCAVRVRPISDGVQPQLGEVLLGSIKSLLQNHGFIKLD